MPTGADRPQVTLGTLLKVPPEERAGIGMNEEAIEAQEPPFGASCTEAGPSRKSYAPSAGRSLQLL